jgi:ParB family transcriptional regulator, chromosome partitioning protein
MTDPQVPEPYRRRLGRGLSALLGGSGPAYEEVEIAPAAGAGELRHIAIDGIARNPFQPRKVFDADTLTELAESIHEHGVLQPLLVRELGDGFQLVAGERRWLAAQKAGLTTVPCRVVDVVDKTACEFALEENLKRQDLTDLEKAHAFRGYLDHFHCSIEELAKQLSMSRSAMSNILRLLDLPEPVKTSLQGGKISAGHARALLSLDEADQLALCGRIQAESLSVRQTEAAVKRLLAPPVATVPAALAGESSEPPTPAESAPETIPITAAGERPADAPERTHHLRSLEEQLQAVLGAKVEIRLQTRDSGEIVIPFASNGEFERILGELRRRAA